MTLDELIHALQTFRKSQSIPADQTGEFRVVLRCPVANMGCWLHEDMITLEMSDNPVIQIEGGFGA